MNKVDFLRAIVKLRLLQLYYHNCHHLTKGPLFLQDHSFFGDAYLKLEEDYDSVVEYMISMLGNDAFDTGAVIKTVANELSAIKVETMSSEEMFHKALELEEELYEDLTVLDSSGRIGLRNLVEGIATDSDVRCYKMKQRVG